MAGLSLTNPSTWTTSSMPTAAGPVRYWVLADWEAYFEQYEDKNNVTRVLLAVDWNHADVFKKFALGFTDTVKPPPGERRLFRHTPLACPYQDGQHLVSLKKHSVTAGVKADGTPAYHSPNAMADNWPTFQDTTGMPPRIVYDATFACLPYDVVTEDEFAALSARSEMLRYVRRTRQVNPRERKFPTASYEQIGDPRKIALEVGFLPFYDYQIELTWCKVPVNLVPEKGIADCLLRVNDFPFDFPQDASGRRMVSGAYGTYKRGDILFKGLANQIEPYRGPNGEWLVDLPYIFSFQPGDGAGDGQQKVPIGSSRWEKIREKGTVPPNEKFLYQYADLHVLFEPDP